MTLIVANEVMIIIPIIILVFGIIAFASYYFSKKQVVIRNRWGETVYKTDSYNNAIAFDGKNRKGADLADGVYFIAINLYDTDSGKTFEYNGTVTIIRNK